MKKNVLVFGLISGFIVTTFMLGTMAWSYQNAECEGNMLLGYSAMLLAFSLIFVAVKNFRDKYNGGLINFGKAFKIGLFITLIASTIYVIGWVIDYYLFMPDFMDKYTAHVLKEARAGGASQLEMDAKVNEMAGYKEMYKNPLFVVLFTYLEIFPVGLVISLISALILKRKVREVVG